MLRDLKAGAGYVRIGFKLIVAPGLRRYILVPLSINGRLSRWGSLTAPTCSVR